MVFQWSLSDSKSPQVSRTHLSILAVLNNAIVSMVSTPPQNSKSSSLFKNPLATVKQGFEVLQIIINLFLFACKMSKLRINII